METLVDVARESFLILDANFKVISANPLFYQTFEVSSKQTKGKSLYRLGDDQWDIPELRKLLGEVLPKKKTVKDYEVKHFFEKIGEKTIVLNARQIDAAQLIILAFEDITDRRMLEERLADHTKELEVEVEKRTKELADKIRELETVNKSMVGRELKMVELKKDIQKLLERAKNSSGKNGNGKNGNRKNGK
jgi:nitrogen-specific signal transduction histidine kinase